MRRITKLMMFMLFSVLIIHAENAIKVYEPDGNVVFYKLIKRPLVSFSGNEIILSCDESSISYSLDANVKFEFVSVEDEATGINGLIGSLPSVEISPNQINISHMLPNSLVSVYDLSGKMVIMSKTDNEGHAEFDNSLKKGIYILKTSYSSIKFQIK